MPGLVLLNHQAALLQHYLNSSRGAALSPRINKAFFSSIREMDREEQRERTTGRQRRKEMAFIGRSHRSHTDLERLWKTSHTPTFLHQHTITNAHGQIPDLEQTSRSDSRKHTPLSRAPLSEVTFQLDAMKRIEVRVHFPPQKGTGWES